MSNVVIVTGAGSGIGRATALLFAERGHAVIASGRRLENLQATQALAADLDGEVIPLAGDVGVAATAEKLIAAAEAQGGLGYLVNNAGIGWSYGAKHPGAMAAVKDTSYEQWREVQRINLDSVFLLCHSALPRFVTRGSGSIVNVASGGGLVGMADAHSYATAKAGVVNMTRSMAKAYGPAGIRSNVVAPGFVDTEMVEPVLNSEANPFADESLRYQVSPLGRPGRPEEVAEAIYFMAVRATYCNGAVLVVDGGSLA